MDNRETMKKPNANLSQYNLYVTAKGTTQIRSPPCLCRKDLYAGLRLTPKCASLFPSPKDCTPLNCKDLSLSFSPTTSRQAPVPGDGLTAMLSDRHGSILKLKIKSESKVIQALSWCHHGQDHSISADSWGDFTNYN